MNERPLANQRVLVIDDESVVWDQVKRYVDAIDRKLLKDSGIDSITLEFADSVEQAEEKIAKAGDKFFHLALLDLRLDLTSKACKPKMMYAFDLLQDIFKNKNPKGVVVISNYGDYLNLREAFKGGVIDFLRKPLDAAPLEPAIVDALVRIMTQDTERLLNQRVFDLVAHAQLGLAHGFRQIFFTLLQEVTEATEKCERYAPKPDSSETAQEYTDPLNQILNSQREALAKARHDWASIQSGLISSSSELSSRNISEMLIGIKRRLEPALVVKQVIVSEAESYNRNVHSFENDVEIVLNEIIAGSLSEIENPDAARKIKISFVAEATRVGVVFEDNLDPISEKHANIVNDAFKLISDSSFGRAWGLSVAQHVALRGGGEIKVGVKNGKNVITYYIPLADHE